jgi:hypothetical protein
LYYMTGQNPNQEVGTAKPETGTEPCRWLHISI